jgi:hypothetical protein
MMTISHILKTTGYGSPSAASQQAGGHCAGFIPWLPTASGFLGRMYLPHIPGAPPPA